MFGEKISHPGFEQRGIGNDIIGKPVGIVFLCILDGVFQQVVTQQRFAAIKRDVGPFQPHLPNIVDRLPYQSRVHRNRSLLIPLPERRHRHDAVTAGQIAVVGQVQQHGNNACGALVKVNRLQIHTPFRSHSLRTDKRKPVAASYRTSAATGQLLALFL